MHMYTSYSLKSNRPILSDKTSDKNCYLVLEFCQGESLDSFMKKDLKNSFGVGVADFHSALIGKLF